MYMTISVQATRPYFTSFAVRFLPLVPAGGFPSLKHLESAVVSGAEHPGPVCTPANACYTSPLSAVYRLRLSLKEQRRRWKLPISAADSSSVYKNFSQSGQLGQGRAGHRKLLV